MNQLRMIRAAFTKYPILTNSVFYGSLYCAAEFTQQTVHRKFYGDSRYQRYNWEQLRNYFVIGFFPLSPTLTIWYKWLDKKFPQTTPKVIVKKLILDQFGCTPVVIAMFFIGMAILEGQSDIFEDARTKLLPTLGKSCLFWLPAQTVNFIMIPPTFRVAYIATCAFFWVNILCVIKRQDIQ